MSDKENLDVNPETGRIVLPNNNNQCSVFLSDTNQTTRCETVIKPHIIPVIFLPGIMGSNLKSKLAFENGRNSADAKFVDEHLWNFDIVLGNECGNYEEIEKKAVEIIRSVSQDKAEKVWNVFTPVDTLRMTNKKLIGMKGIGEAIRQKKLNPDQTTVDYYPFDSMDTWWKKIIRGLFSVVQPKNPNVFSDNINIDLAIALMRGWGSVSASSYWGFLAELQKSLDAMPNKQQIALACQNIEQEFRASPLWEEILKAEKPIKQDYGDSKLTLPMYSNIYDPSGFQQTSRKEDMDKIEPNKHLFGTEQPSAISDGALKEAINYRYLVYACGYNWLHSNQISANGGEENTEIGMQSSTDHHHLTKVIDKILENVQKSDPTCKQVILVTHSMGGLVARAYAKNNVDKVLGVVHGVMPATGAASFYKRIRAGFGGVEGSATAAKVLGDDGYKTSAIMTHAIGALELAPSDSYGDSFSSQNLYTVTAKQGYQSWLKVCDGKTNNVIMQLPTPLGDTTDPYEQIYKSKLWYGLVPAYTPDIINATTEDKNKGYLDSNRRIDPMGNFNYRDLENKKYFTDLEYFYKNIDLASQFHQKQVTKIDYHPNTYACVIIDKIHKAGKYNAYGKVELHINGATVTSAEVANLTLIEDKGDGNSKLCLPDNKTMVTATITKPTDAGDATVPGISAIAPAHYIKELWELSDGKHDHQASWEAHNAQLFALYAITKISQQRG